MTSMLPSQAMILAAGRGKRMRPLTDTVPKPLLKVGGKPLLVWHIEHLAKAGIRDIIINTAWCGMAIPHALGDGRQWGVRLRYSHEAPPGLETAGGIALALKRGLLDRQAPFLVISGDTWCEAPAHAELMSALAAPVAEGKAKACLLLTQNPPHHPEGDFNCPPSGGAAQFGTENTFTGIGAYDPALFAELAAAEVVGFTPLRTLYHQASEQGQLWAQHYEGLWYDIGTPERLSTLEHSLST